MANKQTLRGMATLNFYAVDVAAASKWYGELLGIEPYFQRADAENLAYVEFRIGDYQDELGIINARYAPKNAATPFGGAVTYWHVDDLEGMLEKLKAMGAKEYEPITKRGEGFVTASVIDPFGNVLGIMYNSHYLEVFGAS